jgi:hypothetical protein
LRALRLGVRNLKEKKMFDSGLSALMQVMNTITKFRTDLINEKGFLYAVDFETRLNLDILSALNFDKLNTKDLTPAFAELVNCFETEATLALVAGNDRTDWKKLLELVNKNWKGSSVLEPEDKDSPKEAIKDALDAFSFVARKIEALKRIARIAEKNPVFLKEINLKTRLKNLNGALFDVNRCLALVIRDIDSGKKKPGKNSK